MTGLSLLIVLSAAVVLIVAVTIFIARQGNPEEVSRHVARLDDAEGGTMLPAPGSRPGGPGQESQNVVDRGEIAPGEPESR